MNHAPRTPVSILSLLLAFLVVPDLHAAQVGAAPVQVDLVEIDKLNASLLLPDGSVVEGGHLGPQTAGCSIGTHAFIQRKAPGGSTLWARYANAGTGCTGTGSGGDSIFESVTGVDTDYIVGSSMTTLQNAATGELYAAVSSLLAWKTSPEADLSAAWGLLLIVLDASGNHVADRYFGAQPSGLTVDPEACDQVCAALAGRHDQYGAEALALRGQDLWVTGWFRPRITDAEALGDKDVLAIRVADDLSTVHAVATPGFPGHDAGEALAIDHFGIAWITGYYGALRDFFIAAFLPNGTVYRAFVAGGPLDDWGHTVTLIENDTKIVVDGEVTDWAVFAGQTVGAPGGGQLGFTATFDRALGLLSLDTFAPVPATAPDSRYRAARAQLSDGCGLGSGDPPPLGPPPPAMLEAEVGQRQGAGPHVYHPTAFTLIEGRFGSGTVHALQSSDDCYLSLGAKTDPAEEALEAVFDLPLMDEAPVPHTVSFEFRSEYCASIDIDLGGGEASAFVDLAAIDLCPLDEPVVTIEVPSQVAASLGFVPGAPVSQMAPLRIKARIVLEGAPCEPDPFSLGCNTSGGKDCDIDDVSATSDYGT